MVIMSLPLSQMGSFNRSYYWYDAKKGFSWARYLECMSAKAAPARAFMAQPPLPPTTPFPPAGGPASRFACGMKLEAIDPEKPALICAVSVVDVLGECVKVDNYRVTIHIVPNLLLT